MTVKPEETLETLITIQKTHDERIGGVERRLESIGLDIADIKSGLKLLSARPSFDVAKAITLMVQGGILFSMVVSGIIWLAVQLSSSDLTALRASDMRSNEIADDLRQRVMRLEGREPGALR